MLQVIEPTGSIYTWIYLNDYIVEWLYTLYMGYFQVCTQMSRERLYKEKDKIE